MGIDMIWDGKDEVPSGGPKAGTYTFKCVKAEEKSSNAGKFLALECEGQGTKRKLYENLYFTPKAIPYTKARLTGLGVPNGLTPLKPHYFVGAVFEAVCKLSPSKKLKDDGTPFMNLQVDVFAEREGFTGGIRLIEPSVNMPVGSVATPEEEDDGSAPF